jgi:hypothetical protein
MLLGYAFSDTWFGSLVFPFFLPWFILAAMTIPPDMHSVGLPLYFKVALFLTFLCTWFTLWIVVTLIGKLITRRRREHE